MKSSVTWQNSKQTKQILIAGLTVYTPVIVKTTKFNIKLRLLCLLEQKPANLILRQFIAILIFVDTYLRWRTPLQEFLCR